MEDNYLLLSPYHKISINGKELDKQRYESVYSINIHETLEGSDSCTISVLDTNALFIEDNIFLEESTITADIGFFEYPDPFPFSGYISAIDPDFPENGDITLNINCIDTSHRMNRMKKSKTWDKVTSADVVGSIVSSYGIQLEKDFSFTYKFYDTVAQTEQTDLEFIESLLDGESQPCYARMSSSTTYTYAPINFKAESKTSLHYKLPPYDIISFKPTINRETLKEGSTKQEIDLQDKTVLKAFVSITEPSPITQGEKMTTTSRATSTGYSYGTVANTGYTYGGDILNSSERDEKLQTDVEKEMMANEILTLVGDVNVLVNDRTIKLRVGDVITMYGLGKYLSGDYIIKGRTRSLSSNFTLSFSVAKTGFGNSIKSSVNYVEIPSLIPDSSTPPDLDSNVVLDGAELFTFECTAYTATGNATASGVMPTPNHTVASWDGLEFGTRIYIPSRGVTYTVEDRGGAVTYGIIDIYMDTEQECWDFGRQWLDGYILK